MTYGVELTGSARKDILALGDDTYARVAAAIDGLQDDPRPRGVRKLRGREHAWRLRVADFRVLYEVDYQTRGHRRAVRLQ